MILASGQGAFLYLLGRAIQRFRKKRLPLRLLSMRGPEVIEAVRSGHAHVGVAASEVVPSDLEVTPLRSVGQMLVVPISHRLAKQKQVQPADLCGETLIVPPSGSPHRAMLANILAANGATWNLGVEATGWELIVHFAQYGLGAAIVNDVVTLPRGLAGIPMGGFPAVKYYLFRRSGLHGHESNTLCDLIRETVAER